MDNQKRPVPSEKNTAPSAASRAPRHAASSEKRAVSDGSHAARAPQGKHVASPRAQMAPASKPNAGSSVGIHYSRPCRNSRYKRDHSPLNRFIASVRKHLAWPRVRAHLTRRWPLYAGGAAVLLVVVLCIALIPGPVDKVAAGAVNAPANTQIPEATQTPLPTAVPETTATPEPAATPEPTLAPTPIPTVTMSPKYKVLKGIPNTDRALGLPECEMVDHSYFNDTVFIGDSVSEKLHLYVTKMRKTYPELLGNAKFITTPSLSSRNALKPVSATSLHPTIRGKKMTIEDAVALSGAKKVYVMLGMNDVGVSGVNESVNNLFTLLRKIKDKCPDIQIFVQSATPRMKGDKPTTSQLFKYNLKVYQYCLKYTDYGIYFVDVAYVMRNKYGNLTSSYCSDPDSMAIHFTDKACKKWIKFLYTHALV